MATPPNDEPSWTPITAEQARGMGWELRPGGLGTVTRACDEFLLTSQGQRAYLRVTLRWMQERFDSEWQEVMQSPAHDDQADPFDTFQNRLGMSPGDWKWMTLAGVVRDAVTAYEVYVVKAFQKVLQAHWHEIEHGAPLPQFKEVVKRVKVLGLDAPPEPVHEVFELRNVLTHQRGELRTQQERDRYSEEGNVLGQLAHLTEEMVLSRLDVLQAAVDDLDPVLWAYSWGRQVAPPLMAAGRG